MTAITATTAVPSQELVFLSEVFPLSITQANLASFTVTPEIDQETGNRLSFHLSRKLEQAVAVWHEYRLWVLTPMQQPQLNLSQCQIALLALQQDIPDLCDQPLQLQEASAALASTSVLSKVAFQILRIRQPFRPILVTSVGGLAVNRKIKFWAETIELQGEDYAALSLTIRTEIAYLGSLADFYTNNVTQGSPEALLVGLPIQDFDMGSNGSIVQIIGVIAEHRDRLLQLAAGHATRHFIETAPDDEIVVAIRFGKGKKLFHYTLSALRPSITAETAGQFGFDYGQILQFTKIPNIERQRLLANFKAQAADVLMPYGFAIRRSLNSSEHPDLFWQPVTPVDQTPLLFGKGVIGVRGRVLQGLSNGGVYHRHPDFQPGMIRIAALKLCDSSVNTFLEAAQQRLKRYGFESEIIDRKALSISDLSAAEARAALEKTVNKLITVPVDIVLAFLPQNDRDTDEQDGSSLYHLVYSLLLRRNIASQVIYDGTLTKVEYGQILNQVVPGILAKLGNLPFILAEPLEIADYFIGLDISRLPKAKLAGTLNACASVRLYGKQGEFIHYLLEDALLEGEEIPQRLLERLLPTTLEDKTVLIYRDGRFCGREIPNLLERAQAIGAKFILVECRKSGIPRLYNLRQKTLAAPSQGLALRLSSHEAVLITTQVSERVGLARPLRLTVHDAGQPAPIEKVVDTTLKLTLLHHGALKAPRLPMPIYGADRVAGLRLKGIYPSSLLEGDRQFWL
ncbi:stem cell self-renewal protein Piwi [Nodosilinea sp. LEGE 07298]|uniref:Piwi domain-containing protein n=1 Tax=Nodosilinea sp. LEGE 07298 TaxID=2777970 RepID=UPI001881FFF8|nr:Piwi domain-containing protein [Nodosilinea sp. LEGE 07298]MBE9111934.1 stem cell self-renewal protein Piwi [Nodosilinea sp. LEGE 07298]